MRDYTTDTHAQEPPPASPGAREYVFKEVVFQQLDMHPVHGAWCAKQKAFLATAVTHRRRASAARRHTQLKRKRKDGMRRPAGETPRLMQHPREGLPSPKMQKHFF